MENKHEHHGSNAFVWGLLIGALLATLIATKKGRQILRDFTDLSLELLGDFIEEKTQTTTQKTPSDAENLEDAGEDLASEVTEVEQDSPPEEKSEAKQEVNVKNGNGNGHTKKRLFKGIKRK